MKLFRESKQSFCEKLADKTLFWHLSSKDWRSTHKSFILPETQSSITPLEVNNIIHTDERDKANVLNNHFQSDNIR